MPFPCYIELCFAWWGQSTQPKMLVKHVKHSPPSLHSSESFDHLPAIPNSNSLIFMCNLHPLPRIIPISSISCSLNRPKVPLHILVLFILFYFIFNELCYVTTHRGVCLLESNSTLPAPYSLPCSIGYACPIGP
jgi:hypothetical protein